MNTQKKQSEENLKITLHSSIESFKKEFSKENNKNIFLSPEFLSVFEKNQQESIEHIFLDFKQKETFGIIYAQIFEIGGIQINNYYSNIKIGKKIIRFFLNLIKFRILGFGNNFLTNEPTISVENVIENPNEFLYQLTEFLNKKKHINKFIFPDHFFSTIGLEDPLKNYSKLIKIEVDEEMFIDLNPKWKSFEDYKNSFNKKYKKRLKNVFYKSQAISFKKLSTHELIFYENQMQILFNNVRESSSFYSESFNVKSYLDFQKIKDLTTNVYGLFLEDKLVAFCSEWIIDNKLYSYFIGLDYSINKSHSLYERILYHTIENGIKNRVEKVILGRTAAEFKSNVGAKPKKSFIYIFIKNPILRIILNPILSIVKPKKWIQRNPFKTLK